MVTLAIAHTWNCRFLELVFLAFRRGGGVVWLLLPIFGRIAFHFRVSHYWFAERIGEPKVRDWASQSIVAIRSSGFWIRIGFQNWSAKDIRIAVMVGVVISLCSLIRGENRFHFADPILNLKPKRNSAKRFSNNNGCRVRFLDAI